MKKAGEYVQMVHIESSEAWARVIRRVQQDLIEETASIAEAIDSKRGNEAEIVKAIRALL